MSFSRATAQDVIGSFASPATVNTGNGTQSGIYDCTSPTNQIEITLYCNLIAGATAPTAAITVKWECSLDGTNYFVDTLQSFTLTNSGTTVAAFVPTDPVQKVRCTVTNPDSTRTITTHCQGTALVGS